MSVRRVTRARLRGQVPVLYNPPFARKVELMLKQLGRLERTRSIIIVGFAILMAVSLVFFYAPGPNAVSLDPTKNTEVLAKVGSDSVTVADLAQLREGYRQQFGDQISLQQLGGNKRFLEGLIRDRVIAQEAHRLGLSASKDEVAERIRKQFTDASGQFIGLDRYKERVMASYGDIEKFERSMADFIAQEKLKAFVTASVNVSDQEVEDTFKREKTAFDVSYVVVDPVKLAARIQTSEDEQKAYFEQHKDDYRILEPQRKVRYVFIDQEKAGSKIAISDADLRSAYERLEPQHKQAGVKVQQILLKVAHQDLDAGVEQKAKDLIAKLRGTTGKATEEAFAEVARGNSEDPATAKNGGLLAQPIKANPNKPHGLYDRAVDLTVGDVTDVPIRYAGNWYILRRGEEVAKTFEQAKPELLVSTRNTRGYAAAAKLADRAVVRLKEIKDPQKVAQELAAEANMSAGEMVKETPFVVAGDDVPNIGNNQEFFQSVEALNNPSDVGDKIGVRNGFAIPMLVEKKEPRIRDYDEVKTKVAEALKKQKATEQLESKAKEIAASAGSAADLKATAEQAGLEAATEEAYKLGSPLGAAGTSPALDEALFALKSGEVTKAPIKVGESWVVAGVTKRTDADMAAYASERDRLSGSLLKDRQDQLFEDYIAATQARMKNDGKITIYKEVLTKMEADETAASPRFPNP